MASPAKWNTIIALGLIALVFTLIPFRGLPFGRWLAGANVHASMPLLALLAEAIWKSFGQRGWLRDRDRAMTWLFGGVAGCILYPLALGLGSFDPYIWGWQFSLLFVGTSVLTLLFLWKQNRFGFLLFLSIIAYDLRCLESTNLWDYLVDPIYWLLSLAMLAKGIWKEVRRKKIPSLPQPTCSAMNAR